MLDKHYGPFNLDAAADSLNHLCDRWLGPGSSIASNALAPSTRWHRYYSERYMTRVFCNPPYSLTARFVARAKRAVEDQECLRVTLLVPATTDVRWFHEYIYLAPVGFREGVTCDFSVGRVRFLRPDGTRAGQPTHGSMFVTFERGC